MRLTQTESQPREPLLQRLTEDWDWEKRERVLLLLVRAFLISVLVFFALVIVFLVAVFA